MGHDVRIYGSELSMHVSALDQRAMGKWSSMAVHFNLTFADAPLRREVTLCMGRRVRGAKSSPTFQMLVVQVLCEQSVVAYVGEFG